MGGKKNSDGKNVFWYGYKAHLAVGTQSQYILGAVLSSGNLNDGKADIPLLKGLALQHSHLNFEYVTMDAGYDYETIKYVRPKACESCPLAHDSLCQKVYKMKITTNLRKYTDPARGSKLWKEIAKRRSAVERVNAYLKEFF